MFSWRIGFLDIVSDFFLDNVDAVWVAVYSRLGLL